MGGESKKVGEVEEVLVGGGDLLEARKRDSGIVVK